MDRREYRVPSVEKCTLLIKDLKCASCSGPIENSLRNLTGIRFAEISHVTGRGIFEFDTGPGGWTVLKLIERIEGMGFATSLVPSFREDVIQLCIRNKNSMSTSQTQEDLSSIAGVSSVDIVDSDGDIQPLRYALTFNRGQVKAREIIEQAENMQYDVTLYNEYNHTQLRSLRKAKEILEWRQRFILSLFFALPMFFITMVGEHIPRMHSLLATHLFNGIYLGDVIALVLTTPAQFWVGAQFHRAAFKSIRHGIATMDVLIMLGTSAAYFYSFLVMAFAMFDTTPSYRPFLFFETSTMLISFVSLGRYLENKAKGKTSTALTDLMALAPPKTTIYTDVPTCMQDKEILTELVEIGDIVKLRPEDKIPADGTVVRGSSSVNESAITGEAVPVIKQVGDSVTGGTRNGLGTFDMIVTRAGKDTTLTQIVKLVEEAQSSKAPIQAFADKVAGYFVPTVVSLAGITFFVWAILTALIKDEDLPEMFHRTGANKFGVCLQMCISVVVVSCPCALGLATPTAIMVGTGVGTRNGILIKGGSALEAAKSIRKVVLDKTGTITTGKMCVTGMHWVPLDRAQENKTAYARSVRLDGVCADGITGRREVIAMVSTTEAKSEHPLAKAITAYGKGLLGNYKSKMEVESFESVTGQGVKSTISCNGQIVTLLIGTAKFITGVSAGIEVQPAQRTDESTRSSLVIPPLPTSLAAYGLGETKLGRTVIYVSILASKTKGRSEDPGYPQPILAFSLSDSPKLSSRRAIMALENMGVEVYMMTGDGEATAFAIAKQVAIKPENVYAEMSPGDKADAITDLTGQGCGVAMVGDGINDSPALAAATLGIALSSGTSIAVDTADIVLMRSDLLDVVATLHLSHKVLAVIKRNLIWACVYNIFCIPLAMGLFLPLGLYMHPMLAGAAMALSSVSVVTSSLTLNWWERPQESLMLSEAEDENTVMSSSLGVVQKLFLSSLGWARRRVCGGPEVEYTQIPVELTEREVV